MNIFQSHTSSNNDIEIPLQISLIESTPSLVEVLTQTELATITTQQTI